MCFPFLRLLSSQTLPETSAGGPRGREELAARGRGWPAACGHGAISIRAQSEWLQLLESY